MVSVQISINSFFFFAAKNFLANILKREVEKKTNKIPFRHAWFSLNIKFYISGDMNLNLKSFTLLRKIPKKPHHHHGLFSCALLFL